MKKSYNFLEMLITVIILSISIMISISFIPISIFIYMIKYISDLRGKKYEKEKYSKI